MRTQSRVVARPSFAALAVALFATAWFLADAAKAQSDIHELLPPGRGFALYAPVAEAGHSPQLYGATSPTPDWAFAQWDIPERLPPFRDGLSRNRFASVRLTPDGGYRLTQTTGALPCSKRFTSGRDLPDEFDLFAQALHPLAMTVGVKPGREPSLAAAQTVRHSLAVEIDEGRALDRGCQHTMANVLTAIVLANPTANQTLFYQIYMGRFVARADQARLVSIRPAPSWFRTGRSGQSGATGSFGYDDNIWSSYGLPPAAPGATTRLAADVLPRLRAVIADGRRYGLDQDLSHWRVTGSYHGQNAFGHVTFSSAWSGFALRVTASRP